MKKFNSNIMVCLNKFTLDTEEEIECVREYCASNNVEFAINDCWKFGSDGGIELANKIVSLLDDGESEFRLLYNDEDSIIDKIRKVSKEIYGADDIEISTEIVDARCSAEYVTPTFLPCILLGLSQAPQINSNKGLGISDLDFLVVPHNAIGGIPVMEAVKRDIKIFAIEENSTVLSVTPNKFGIKCDIIKTPFSVSVSNGILYLLWRPI